MTHQVVSATEADAATLSQVIATAFHDLPPSEWLISDDAQRRHIFPGYFRILLEHALAAGTVHTTPGRTAVALWLWTAESGPQPPPAYDARLADATGRWIRRFVMFDTELDRHHLADTAHHHLAILAVHPRHQGNGIGTALLDTHHAALDRAGTPAYLEASSPRSRDLYLRHGYSPLAGAPFYLPEGGPPLWSMWRPPRPPRPGDRPG